MLIGRFLENLASKVVLYFSAIIAILIVLANIVGIFTFQDLLKFNSTYEIILIIGIFIAILFCSRYLYKIKDEKRFIIALFLVGFIVRLVSVIIIKTEPVSDFKILYDAANNISSGDYNSVLSNGYFNLWVYQLGFTGYLTVLIKLFGNSVFMIKVINCIVVSLIPLVIYYSAKLIVSKKSAKIVSLAYCFYIGSIVTTSVLTNQHMATLFFYLSIYLLLSNLNGAIKWILVGVCLGLGQFFRPEGAIVILAILLFLLFKNISSLKETTKNIAGGIAAFLIMTLMMQGFSAIFIRAGITKYNLSNRDPLWKFSCGLNPDTKGLYSVEDDAFIGSYEGGRKEANMILIKERIKDPKAIIKTMVYKTSVMWADDDTSLSFAFTDDVSYRNMYDTTIKIEKIQYIIVFIVFTLSIVMMLTRREKFLKNYIYLIIFLGYFFAHLLIEVQTRYRYFSIPIFFIISAYGIDNLIKDK
ncbi:glycosyltransferase family 39 protein [Clostridium sp. NSJ-6]|uniref:Glycosyltransferase family 39 protein n=1 Tax=Clostridium hominis TaxID=2763036 RepID=A0ABR7D9M4_9CLOT|nr:glycosyltransferase family 39 protein [Clostridium hominis]